MTEAFVMHGARDALAGGFAHIEMLAAEAADAIVGFLSRVHRQDRMSPSAPRALYDDNPDFNTSVDEAHSMVRIFEVEFRPSEVLYQMEPETYRVYLAEFDAEAASADASTTEVAP